MSRPTVPIDSFEAIFCAQYGVAPANYAVTVLRLTLYPHARWLAGPGATALFAVDHAFVESVGQLRRWRDFPTEAREFQQAPANRRFWRRQLRVRISVRRMRALFSEVMGGTVSGRTTKANPAENSADPGSFVVD